MLHKTYQIIKRRWDRHEKSSRFSGLMGRLGLLTVGFILFSIFAGLVVLAWLSYGLPTADQIRNLSFTESTQILDKDGGVLYNIHGEENRQIVPLKQISPYIIDATIAVEDRNFYEHHGFYLKRIVGAVINNLQGKPLQGASTITQQLAKNVFLTPERTLKRKLQDLILAVKIENQFSKQDILEMYLNAIPYGNNAYGVQQAARIYFDKDAVDLDLAESAILASLPKGPSRYNPYGQHRESYLLKEFTPQEIEKRNITKESHLREDEFSRGLLGKNIALDEKHKVYIRGRADIVLREMVEIGKIEEDQKQEAWERLQTIEFKKAREKIKAPHFVFYIRELLEEKYGKELIEKGGLRVYTTIDSKMQEAAEKVILANRQRNLDVAGAKNAAMVVIDPNTGHILAMVGSTDYWNEEIDGNVNVTTRPKQPGSAFKPFVYAKIFSNGPYGPGSPLWDIPLNMGGDRPPRNYDNKFRGPLTMRRALGHSLNIPAIQAYFLAGEEKEIIPYVKKFGVNINPKRTYGWPLGLGSGEAKLLELTAGYGVFASGGKLYPTTGILKIIDSQGEIKEEWKPPTEAPYVIDSQTAFLINDILSDPVIYLGQRVRINDYIVAAKTGTSTKPDPSDPTGKRIVPASTMVFMYTPKIVVGVWAGNTDGSALKDPADGYTISAPIASDFYKEAIISNFPSEQFPKPEGIEKVRISFANGKLPGPQTPTDMIVTDYFASFSKPTEIDHDYKQATIDTMTNELATPYCPQESVKTKTFRIYHSYFPEKYKWWENAVQAWARAQSDSMPTKPCHLHNEDTFATQPTITIIEPQNLSSITAGKIQVTVKVDAANQVEKVEFSMDGMIQYIAQDSPYEGAVRLSPATKPGSRHTIGAKVFDKAGYSATSSVEVEVKKSRQEEIEEIINTVPEEPSETPPSSEVIESPPVEPPPLETQPPVTEPEGSNPENSAEPAQPDETPPPSI